MGFTPAQTKILRPTNAAAHLTQISPPPPTHTHHLRQLVKAVCAAYKGAKKPKACSKQGDLGARYHKRCYKGTKGKNKPVLGEKVIVRDRKPLSLVLDPAFVAAAGLSGKFGVGRVETAGRERVCSPVLTTHSSR